MPYAKSTHAQRAQINNKASQSRRRGKRNEKVKCLTLFHFRWAPEYTRTQEVCTRGQLPYDFDTIFSHRLRRGAFVCVRACRTQCMGPD